MPHKLNKKYARKTMGGYRNRAFVSAFDTSGSYTGNFLPDVDATPEQDADDL